VPDQPLDAAEIVALAEEHNRAVLEQAGLPPSSAPELAH
jgi:hypothetical protein